MSKKQKEKKKKDREKSVYQKILKKREALRAERKLAFAEEFQRQQIEFLSNGKPEPIISEEKAAVRAELKSKAVLEQLNKNLKILEALEKEYDEEQKNRIEINESLEAQGFSSIKEKMDAIHQQALEMTGKAEEMAVAKKEYNAYQETVLKE